jgi:hypothetical protein
MVYQAPQIAPASQLEPERRGLATARFCRSCREFYPLHRGRHAGKALHGRDHISSPCIHHGDAFLEGADWWEPAVEVLPPAPVPAPIAAPLAP